MQDLIYTVQSNVEKGTKINLLDKVSGFFEPGQMTALMGPSGSGKTVRGLPAFLLLCCSNGLTPSSRSTH